MDIGKSFSYVFEDPKWITKVAIGGGIFFGGVILSFLLGLPLLAAMMVIMGYSLTVLKNVYEGSPAPLPEWNDFGALFMKGLYAVIGMIVIFIPTILIACCNAAITGFLANQTSDSSGNTAQAASIVLTCLQCISAIYSLVAVVYLYAPLSRYALNGQLSTFWDFGGNLAYIRANIGSYVIALILAIVAGIAAEIVGTIACFIGVFFTYFWSQLVMAHLFGQYARTAAGTAGPAPMSPMSPMAPPPMTPTPLQ
ncbi:MAG: DUF4013 domain-containing protein [Anaerolineae bacterium]